MLGIVPIKPNLPRQGTTEPHGSRTALHELIAQVVTRQQLLVRPGLDELVDQRVAARVVRRGVGHAGARERLGVQDGAVREGLADGAWLEVRGRVGEILAAGDRHGAQPVLVGGRAIGTGAC